ncbi:FkbM family methyltransferase [Algoriphagus resistens]|uniref:FkbM family methyltransferase n=1 Tax=Algoriphagus resistens TaxID=1750590 RepID=UPI000716C3DF|nr:FkbM family methyltransferase [Algoriphagus resistens]
MNNALKRKLYNVLSRSRKKGFVKTLLRLIKTIYFALENKNNDQKSNGEVWLINQLKDSEIKLNTIFDVGANVGNWTRMVRSRFPNSRYHIFEPLPSIYRILEKSFISDLNLKINNLALSNSSGEIDFNFCPDQPSFSSIYKTSLRDNFQTIQIFCQRGEDYCLSNRIEYIDFLKIDTEGSEPFVLQGFDKMLSSGKVKIIQFEYGPHNIKSKFLIIDFYIFFKEKGYVIGKIYPNHVDFSEYHENKENFILSNYLAVRETETEIFRVLGR